MILWYNSLKLQKSDPLIRTLIRTPWKTLLVGIVAMWDFDSNTKYPSIWLRNGSKIFEKELQWISGYELVRNSLFFTFFVFFFFEGLWWKFFSALEAWIHRVSLICGLLRFLEAFKLDSSELWDLGMWFGWFLFECFSYLKVCGGSSSGFWRLEFVEPRWFMVCWGFWRLLSLIPVTFEI